MPVRIQPSPAHLRTRRFLVIANALMLSYLITGPQPNADHEPMTPSARPGGSPIRQSRSRNDSKFTTSSSFSSYSGSGPTRKKDKDDKNKMDPWDSRRFRKEGDFDPENPQATSGMAKIRKQQEESLRFIRGGSRSSRK